MPASENARTNCPHCDQPYYPRWITSEIGAPRPNRRDGTISVGRIWATTCTSCNCPIFEIRARQEGEPVITGVMDADQVFPLKPEWVIELVVNVFIDFENIRRDQAGESKMTDEEQSDKREGFRKFFSGILETVKTGGDAAEVMSKYLPFFAQLTKLLPSS